ncbi:MAG: twin-arginine translocase subunit TatB [Gammaproteobacteria bacterium]|nr:twin-arginine translocase subunit TatB [Gammaproteobacteria bacterium]
MFDIGFWELLVLAGLGLLILGPERLPRVVGQLGRWMRQARRTASQLRWQIEHELDLTERREAEQKRRAQQGPVDADGTRTPPSGAGTREQATAEPTAAGDPAPAEDSGNKVADLAEKRPAAPDTSASTRDQ